jgi:TRAP-type C4-dicarboxylate transport system substrate-binding protein
MKKFKRLMQLLLLCVLLTVLALDPAMAAAKKIRVCGSWNSLSMFKNFEKPFWTEIVPKEMGFETSMTSLGQANLKGAAVLRATKIGVFDVVYTVADYVVSDSPALAGLDLPALAPDIETARKVVDAYWDVMDEYLAKDFDVKLLSIIPYPAQVLFSTEKINSLADLKGKKIRASGWTTSEFVKALDATGVTMSFSEVPTALQRGIVTGAITGSLSGYSAGWGEVSNFVYPLPMGGWDYVIGIMSMATWNTLSADEKSKLQGLINEKMVEPAWKVTNTETQAGLDCLSGKDCSFGKPGQVTLLPITKGDIELANQILRTNVLPEWSKKVGPDVIKQWNKGVGMAVGLKAVE